MKKRVISFILCLCTIVALMPTSALAASLISIIRPTVTAPAVGKKPSYTATLPSTASTEVRNVDWSGELDSSGCFKSGVAYTVRVTVAVQAGQDKIISTTASKSILVNGKQAKLEWVSSDQKQATVAYTFPALTIAASTKIKNISIRFPEPTVGSAPPSTSQTTVGLDAAYVKNVEWVSDYDGDVFVDNKDYTVYVTLGVTNAATTIFDLVKATINGDAARIESVSADKQEVVISRKYTSKTPTTSTTYTSLSIKFPEPTVGSVPPTAAQTTLSISNAYVKDVTWVSDYDGATFVDNKDFTVYVTVAIKDGVNAIFKLSNPKINGVTARIESISGDNKEVVLSTTYTSKTETASTHTQFAIKFPEPTVGTTPPTAATTTVSVSSAYIKDVEWVSDYDGDVFVDNKDFTVYVTVAQRSGYTDLLDPKKVTINGKTAKIESISADKTEFVVSMEYTSRNTAPTTVNEVAVTVPSPVVGKTPAMVSDLTIVNKTDTYVKDIVWVSDHDGTTFQSGKTYIAYITVAIKDGVNKIFDLSKATINGSAAAIDSISADHKQVVIAGAFLPVGTPTFTDVKSGDWFNSFVGKICGAGWMTGKGNGVFDPNGNLSLAEVMVLASRLHADHTKNEIPTVSGAWYMTYYSYCQNQGLLTGLNIVEKDLNRAATRYEMVAILDRAASKDKTCGRVNTVNNGFIPDVEESHPHGEVVYRWYRSGIVTGDSNRNFNGSKNITRAEVSVILCQLLELVDRAKI